ncbi:MAG: purine-nucleoside phosphorylase [Sphaerochaetaceae bacterium]|nr:purine-nucleoside phosphorylase [Sphaerochaetaceae bacterium]
MSTHIGAKAGEIAERVLLPGDPLRAKFIAETFLENAVCYNNVRGMLGFTGTYKGKRVSVQGTGMGMPSIGIYAYELINFYGAKRLIRTGTCGSSSKEFDLRDVVFAQAAATDSGVLRTRFGEDLTVPPVADFYLLKDAVEAAEKLGKKFKVGTVLSDDLFYNDKAEERYKVLNQYGVSCVEMECAELFTLGAKHRVQTLGILTVSDMIFENRFCTAEERQQTFTDMMEIALEAI